MKVHIFTTGSFLTLVTIVVLAIGLIVGLRVRPGRAKLGGIGWRLGTTSFRGFDVESTRRSSAGGERGEVPPDRSPAAMSWLILLCHGVTASATVATAVYAENASSAVEGWARSAQAAKAARPAKLRADAAQVWIAGKGRAFDPSSRPPDLTPGQRLDGSLDLTNVGGGPALVSSSDLIVRWLERLPMQNPSWEDHAPNPAASALVLAPALDAGGPSPGGSPRRWTFSTTVPADLGAKRLYLIGHVSYADEGGSPHRLAFVRWYAPDRQRFLRLDKADDDYEMDE